MNTNQLMPIEESKISNITFRRKIKSPGVLTATCYSFWLPSFVEAPSGLEIYQQSERTRMPVPFTPYQRSEWFGE